MAALTTPTGALADVVVDVIIRTPTVFADAIALARPVGTVVVAGTRGFGVAGPGFSPDLVVVKELRILGALGVDVTASLAALLTSGRYPFESVPRRCVGLDDLLATMGRRARRCLARTRNAHTMREARLPRLPVDGAKAAATKRACPTTLPNSASSRCC